MMPGSMPAARSLSILMPVFNERRTVERAIERTLAADLPVDDLQLVVVDDGSTDGTRELLTSHEWPEAVDVIVHDHNRGKGAAVRTALAGARGVVHAIMDADLEYDPQEIALLLPRLYSGDSEAVFGTRGFASHTAFSFWYVVGNRAVTLAANVLYNSWITDIMTCQKALRTDLFRSLALSEDGFGIEPEITARLLRRGVRIYEVPISYAARTRAEGKKLTALDGLRVLRTLARCRVR
jgi:Glycosyltransferases involved in cell wall biogenesis